MNIALLCIEPALLVLEAADIGGAPAAAVYVLALYVRLLAAAACSSATLPSLSVRSPQRSASPPTCGWRVSRRTKIVDTRGAYLEVAGRRNRRNSQPPVAQAADRTRANLAHVRSTILSHLHPAAGRFNRATGSDPFHGAPGNVDDVRVPCTRASSTHCGVRRQSSCAPRQSTWGGNLILVLRIAAGQIHIR